MSSSVSVAFRCRSNVCFLVVVVDDAAALIFFIDLLQFDVRHKKTRPAASTILNVFKRIGEKRERERDGGQSDEKTHEIPKKITAQL